MDEQAAIRRLKTGDISGLETLVSRYQTKAVRAAFLIIQDAQTAEDVVQDAFLQTYRCIGQFDETRSFAPWFMRIVINAALKSCRRAARHVDVDDRAFETLLTEPSPEAEIENAEFQRRVQETLLRLPPRQRAVIVQRYYLEMSEREMAAKLETAPGTVKWLLNAARTRLRALLRKEVEE